MAELITGKLLFNQEKRKWQVEFFNEKKQQPSKMFCHEAEISADIPKNEAEQCDVQFERKPPHGEPIKVRLAGKDFVAPTGRKPTPPTPIAQKQWNAQAQRERREQRPERTNDRMPREFHNPYNFVPAVPRDHVDGAINDLGDKPPAGHDRFHAELLSGKLCVRMTVKTPLLLLDTARVEIQDEHKTYPVREDAKGKPVINPTAIKGMLRSAYEAVTNSRLSVFKEHDERLAFRMESNKGAEVVPVRIEEENGQKKIVFYTGTSILKSNGEPENGNPLCAAWLFRYHTNKEVSKDATKYSTGLPKHGDEVEVYLEKFAHYKWKRREGELSRNPDFTFWRVKEIVPKGETLGAEPPLSTEIPRVEANRRQKSYYRPLGVIENATGIVFVSNHNMQNKHDEKVFFKSADSPDPEILTDEKWKDLKKAWKELVKNYQTEHEKEKVPPNNLKIKEWSRHIQHKDEQELEVGTLCYAKVKSVGEYKFEVEYLLPVMISRKLYENPPEKLLPDCLKPANERNKLSPADRVFGFVNQKGQGAYRGQIRVGAIDCISDKAVAIEDLAQSVPLQILGQPKPQQGRFYVAEDDSGKAQTQKRNNEEAGYKAGRGLRGRKVYPHHKLPDEINESYWQNPMSAELKTSLDNYFREFRRPQKDGQEQRDNQNRSIKGWVKPKTEFIFDIHFINLSEVELGALIWLLSWEDGFHRFGGGKPLGFGSVKLALDGSEIFKGGELKKRYFALDEGALDDKPQPTETKTCLEAFETAINAYPDGNGQRILQSFFASARGFDKPIHYPRTTREPYRVEYGKEVSASFNWFVANNRASGHKLALPDIYDDNGFPLKPED